MTVWGCYNFFVAFRWVFVAFDKDEDLSSREGSSSDIK